MNLETLTTNLQNLINHTEKRMEACVRITDPLEYYRLRGYLDGIVAAACRAGVPAAVLRVRVWDQVELDRLNPYFSQALAQVQH